MNNARFLGVTVLPEYIQSETTDGASTSHTHRSHAKVPIEARKIANALTALTARN